MASGTLSDPHTPASNKCVRSALFGFIQFSFSSLGCHIPVPYTVQYLLSILQYKQICSYKIALNCTDICIYPTGTPGCGGAFTTAQGVVISPNYPNPYQRDAQCVWTITVKETEKITFTFTTIDLEDHRGCSWDYVQV